jgi:FkbM family methyltransferase
MIPDLIYDIGAHRGDDTAFYVAKGFRVVAVEANPIMAAELRSRFSAEILSRTVAIEACGIADEIGELEFYAHDHDDWSSFEINSRFVKGNYKTFQVETNTIERLVAKHGVPYYLKADIEGGERHIIARLHLLKSLPLYLSFENNPHTDAQLDIMRSLGYDRFKVVEQGTKPGQAEAPNPPKEGKYAPFAFTGYMSGAFGRELPGNWLDYVELKAQLDEIGADHARGKWVGWHDIHCWREKAGGPELAASSADRPAGGFFGGLRRKVASLRKPS